MQKSITTKPSCPKGMIIRESYKSKSGKLISARCIKKAGLLPGKASEKTIKLLKKASQRATMAMHMSKKAGLPTPVRCPKGKILRVGYTRRSYNRKAGTHVRHGLVHPGCITKRGKSVSRNKIIVLDPDDHYLSKFGYFDIENKTLQERHDALNKLIKHFEPIKGVMATYNYVIKALNARYILNRNTNPQFAKILKQDQKHISKLYKKILHTQHTQ